MASSSSFAEALAAKKAKLSTTQTRDTSGPRIQKTLADISEADVDSYQKTVQDANIETWEKNLGPLTFRTKYMTMSVEDARAFLEITENRGKSEYRASAELQGRLDEMEARLQALIDEDGWGSRGVFVKTSSRSAKDAAVARKKLLEIYKAHTKQLASGQGPYTVNQKIIGLLHAGTQMLKCFSARDAFEMLTQSERIEQDMRLALLVFDRNGHWDQNLVVREWHDIDVSQEWRCFIKDRKVAAISQYNYLPCFPDLIANRQYLADLLVSFLSVTVIPSLPDTPIFQDMVIDLAVTGDAWAHPKLWVIELNPYLSSTDGALFSWAHDLPVLTGQLPFELRLTEKESAGVKTSMLIEWRELIDTIDIDAP